MKNIITTLLLLLILVTGYSQELRYEVRGTYTRSIKKERLNEAISMSDISPGYPSSWITDYTSTSLTATTNGQTLTACGLNENLTAEQIGLLKTADLGTDIVVDIRYKYMNSVTNNMDDRKMYFTMTVVPEIEAEYSGGYDALMKYLEVNAINKLPESNAESFPAVVIKFTVNEKGEIDNAQVSLTSSDPEIDKILLKAINKMPKWKPAENSKGLKVKQDFQFSIGMNGC